MPPCFIVVCNNTSTSKLVYDFISGFHRQNEDGSSTKAVRPDRDALEVRFPRVAGYRVELPEERLTAKFNDDSTLELTPDLVGPSITRNQGIIGEGVNLTLEHLADMRPSTLLFHLTQHLLYTKWRDTGEAPKLHLFGQLKRITREWLDNHLVCTGGTHRAQLIHQDLADMACNRITAGITAAFASERPIKATLDSWDAALVSLFSLVASGQIKLRRIDGWQTIATVLSKHSTEAA